MNFHSILSLRVIKSPRRIPQQGPMMACLAAFLFLSACSSAHGTSSANCLPGSHDCESTSAESQALGLPPADDLALFGGAQPTFAVAISDGDGGFGVTQPFDSSFNSWASAPGVQRLTGDFNNDGLMDLALVGGPGWNTIPVAYAQGNGTFLVDNIFVGAFGTWASTAGVKAVVGDFNKDGYSDIALTGVAGWTQISVAFSAGQGTFLVTQGPAGNFPMWAAQPNAQVLVGDFNNDGYSDIALTGVSGWSEIPVAFSTGPGSWTVTRRGAGNFPSLAATPGAKVVVGDFNKDGSSDIAVTGVSGWTQISVAFAAGGGSWKFTQGAAANFAKWVTAPGAQLLVGDFDHDGSTDLALTGVGGWNTIPIAFSSGGGNWLVTNGGVGAFGSWASGSGVRALAGDFNGDGFTDVALTGGGGWTSIPVAFSIGGGAFTVTNDNVPNFPARATGAGTTVVVGQLN
jgi:hypothetical protein